MKKTLFTLILLAAVLSFKAQSTTPPQALNMFQMDVNTLDSDRSAKINQFIDSQRQNRSFFGTIGMAVLNTIITQTAGEAVSGIIGLTEITEQRKNNWKEMIQNECRYEESLTYIDNLTDFYAKGSSNGALDPSDFNFNGFTLRARHEGKDVLRFYSHIDVSEAGLNEIINHSKFYLVLDSMYFYPYNCHLPNMAANHIYPDADETYERGVSFNFEERENLMVSINFTITSSWYNQAIMLFQDVELGKFNVQIPINEESLTDGVFVYKKGMSDKAPIEIAGSSFIVPRSYMPLTGGVPHWGTGEYNVSVTMTERCSISDEMLANWKQDYRRLKKMKKDNSTWPAISEYCVQQGSSLLRCSLYTASSTALRQWDWLNNW